MFKISRQQMSEIAGAAARDYEARVVRQLGRQFPGGCFGVPRDELVDAVKQGIERAALRKLSKEKHVGKFIALAAALGPAFDTDPKLPWAQAMLEKLTPNNAAEVLEALSHRAAEHLATRAGVDPAVVTAVVTALTAAPGPEDEPMSDRADVGDPVTPCPKLAPRRLYSFSS